MLLLGNKRAVSIYWTVKWLPEVITLLLGQTDRQSYDRPKIIKTDQFPVVLVYNGVLPSLITYHSTQGINGVNVPLVPVWSASFWDEWVDYYKWSNKLFIRVTVLGMAGIVCLREYTHRTR